MLVATPTIICCFVVQALINLDVERMLYLGTNLRKFCFDNIHLQQENSNEALAKILKNKMKALMHTQSSDNAVNCSILTFLHKCERI